MIAFVYDLIYSIPMCVTIVLLCHLRLGISEMTPLHYVISAACVCFYAVLYHIETKWRILLVGIVGVLLAGVAFAGKAELLKQNLWLLWIFLLGGICFGIERIAHRDRKLRIVIAAAGFVMLVILMVSGYKKDQGVFGLVFFYLLAFLTEWVQTGWKKEGYTDPGKHIVYTLPFLIPVFLVLMLVKVPEDPYDWRFVKTLIREVRTGYEAMVQTLLPDRGWDGDVNMGFSDKAVINGRVQSQPYKVLTVSSDADQDYRLYLGGKTFDTFDGRGWTKRNDSNLDYKALDRLEMIAAILHHDPDHMKNYIQNIRVHIVYDGIRTKHVFAPSKATPDMLGTRMSQSGGDWFLQGSKKADYTVKYYRLNRDHPVFRELLLKEDGRDPVSWEQATQESKGIIREEYSEETYQRYREEIREYCLPEVSLSADAQRFMDDLLSGAQTDLEKLERIEKMLGDMRYTNAPGPLPETVRTESDFIDYLLFEKQEGFCTHFATAFVVLARSQGIPARYVQGYSVLSNARNFEVMSDRGHAWPEAYFDGIGWIGFEPTPGYKRPAVWTVSDGETPAVSAEVMYTGATGTDDVKTQEETGEEKPEEGVTIRWHWILVPLLFGLGFLLFFLAADHLYRKYRYRKMSDKNKILTLCRRDMRILRRIGLKPEPGETLTEFKERAAARIPEAMLHFIVPYEKVLYAGETDCSDMVPLVEEYTRDCGKMIWTQIRNRYFSFGKEGKR